MWKIASFFLIYFSLDDTEVQKIHLWKRVV